MVWWGLGLVGEAAIAGAAQTRAGEQPTGTIDLELVFKLFPPGLAMSMSNLPLSIVEVNFIPSTGCGLGGRGPSA
jgi:hypothetical protein